MVLGIGIKVYYNLFENFYKLGILMIKVRFAPSPTGYLHIGNFRTALVNFLFAKSKNGHFMLRIDDTDDERSSKEYEDAIKEDLTWMNINWDSLERQSSRLLSYNEALETLLEKKRALSLIHI